MRKEIKYIGFYDLPDAKGSRVSTIAAINKMDYIAEAINQAGFDVHIISPSWSLDNGLRSNAQKGETIQIHPKKKVTFCPTYSTRNMISRNLKIIFTLIWLFFWLVKNVKKNEKIIVYHVQWLSLPIRLAKKLKNFHLILEVEEFYGKIWKNKNILNKWENKLIKRADCYIAVSDVLAEILGKKVKAVVFGNYLVPDYNKSNPYFINDKINVVYAGSIDDTKGGAFKAVECAALLPEKYLVHISGHGDDYSIKRLNSEIEKTNNKIGRVACIYHGSISEVEFPNFLQSCQIALNPQFAGEQFSYLFPSKIIKYLAFNLRVVSTGIESIEKSEIARFILFSKDDYPKSLVHKLLTIDLEIPYNSQEFITQLHARLVKKMETEIFI